MLNSKQVDLYFYGIVGVVRLVLLNLVYPVRTSIEETSWYVHYGLSYWVLTNMFLTYETCDCDEKYKGQEIHVPLLSKAFAFCSKPTHLKTTCLFDLPRHSGGPFHKCTTTKAFCSLNCDIFFKKLVLTANLWLKTFYLLRKNLIYL